MNDMLQKLLSLEMQDGALLIMTHENPDPDAIASAAALRHLLAAVRGTEAVVAYTGLIGRAENRSMLELLDLDAHHLDHFQGRDFAATALIDAQPFTGNSSLPDDRLPDIVIDHHPLRQLTRSVRFYDVRVEVGASATILTSYLREAGVTIGPDLATALLYGIRSETQDLTRETSDEDRDAYRYLFALADARKLALISKPPLSERYYLQLLEALEALLVAPPVAICPLGEVTDPDFVPEMADFVARMQGLQSVLVHGYFGDRMYLSIRANDADAKAGEVMQELLAGIGQGGGHGMRAGGNIVLDEPKATDALEGEIRRRFLALYSVSDETLRPLRQTRPREITRLTGA